MSHSIKVHHRPDYKLQDYLALISLPLFCKLHVHGLVFFELLTEFSRWSTVFPATFHRSLRPFEEFNPASAFIWLFGQYNCGLADWPNSHKHFPSLTHPRSLWQRLRNASISLVWRFLATHPFNWLKYLSGWICCHYPESFTSLWPEASFDMQPHQKVAGRPSN